MIDAFAIRPGTAPRVKPKFKGPGATSPSAYRKPQWNSILQRFGHAGVTPPSKPSSHEDQAAAVQRAIDAVRNGMEGSRFGLDFGEAPNAERSHLEFADLAIALLPENADDQNTPRELIESPPELIEMCGRVHAAQLAMTHARAQAATLNDDTFVKSDQLFRYDPEGRSASRGLLLRMARGTARIAEAQAGLEGEMGQFIEMRKRYCDPWRQRSQLLELELVRLQREAESARRDLRTVMERLSAGEARHEAERKQLTEDLDAARRLGPLQVDAITAILTPEFLIIEARWREEVEALEARRQAEREAHERELKEVKRAHAAELVAVRRAHADEMAAKAEEQRLVLEAKLEEAAEMAEHLHEELLEAQQAIPPLEEKVATLVEEKAQQEDDYRKHAEEVKQLWEEKELECEALRNEMTRLQGLHAECLAEGSLEALRRKQIGFAPPAATALVGKARALIYEEALKQPVAQNGLAKPEAVSWRGTTHDYAQPAKDFHQSEMERPEPTYGPRQKAPFRKPPPAPKPLSAYEEAKLLHGRQPEPPRPWPHNQPKSLSPRPRHRPPPTSPVPFFIQP